MPTNLRCPNAKNHAELQSRRYLPNYRRPELEVHRSGRYLPNHTSIHRHGKSWMNFPEATSLNQNSTTCLHSSFSAK
jgi:hypothetical protein